MGRGGALALLALAALLEAGGDALVRGGLHRQALPARLALIGAGAIVLLGYGLCVNLPPWDFGRLLGVYVALFFVAAQAIDLIAFGVRPGLAILIGGGLIVTGALVIALFPPA